MANMNMQYDPRLPRPQAPRGLAPMNMTKRAMAGGGVPLQPIPTRPRPQVMPMQGGLGRGFNDAELQEWQGSLRTMMGMPQPGGGIPRPLGLAPGPGMPGYGQGIQQIPAGGTSLPSLSNDVRRQLAPSLYGTGTAGSANGYVSVPGARDNSLRSQVAAQIAQNRVAPTGLGPYGGLGGSSSAVPGLAILAQRSQQPMAPPRIDRPWNPTLMAQIQEQMADRNRPENIAEANLDRIRATPQYQQNRAATVARQQALAQRLAGNRRDSALAQGVARSRMFGVPLSPAQADLLARSKGAQGGNYTGSGSMIAGTGLNAAPKPFAALQPVSTNKPEVTPEREQQLLGLLNGIDEKTPMDQVDRMRGLVQPGEMEHLIQKHQIGGLDTLRSGPAIDQRKRLLEAAKRIRDGKNYRTPQQEAEGLYAADPFGFYGSR